MRPSKTRFVTACQQLLALGVVLAVLTPAATVISLDVVQQSPQSSQYAAGGRPVAAFAAYTRETQHTSVVPTAPVEADVDEYQLTPEAASGKVAPGALSARSKIGALDGGSQVVSTPEPITGYGAVGVTWKAGDEVPEEGATFEVRTQDDGTWSDWLELEYHDDHGPDPDSAEAAHARPGTDVLLVGRVDEVQVRATTEGASQPRDMRLAVIEPGTPPATARELPTIKTDEDGIAEPGSTEPEPEPTESESEPTGTDDGLDLQAATYTPRPRIYSRAQWGANERLRDKGSLRYYEVHAGFVHHTVNANNYTRDEVPGIIRSIYAYHTQSRGWSDVGYNFLVDKFGRIWEGRAGGVDRAVVGAHTLGYNDYSFAMSAIGNFETARAPKAMVQAYGSLFAWKLSLHGVSAASTRQVVGPDTFQAINGHRDAGSTACPGRYLYAKLARIRTLAAAAQKGWTGRQLESNLASTAHPDLIVRRASDGRAFVIPTNGSKTGRRVKTGLDLSSANRIMNAGDWDRDGFGDFIVRHAANGRLVLYRGNGKGRFATGVPIKGDFSRVGLLAAVGDMTGDGWPDIMGQPKGGAMRIYPGRGVSGIAASYVAHSAVKGRRLVAVGRWDRDGAPDVLVRRKAKLIMYRGNGPGGLTGTPRALPDTFASFDWLIGVSDLALTGHADLILRKRATGELFAIDATTKGLGRARLIATGMEKYDLAG